MYLKQNKMIEVKFTENDIERLNYERYHYPHPLVQRRMESLWLKSQGLKHEEICRLTKISPNTLRNHIKLYKKGGVEALKEINIHKPQSKLKPYTATIESYFREHPPATAKEAMGKIEELTGIKLSENRVRVFLKSIGLKPRKVGMIPAKANAEKQEEFLKNELEPRLEEAKNGQRVVFFC